MCSRIRFLPTADIQLADYDNCFPEKTPLRFGAVVGHQLGKLSAYDRNAYDGQITVQHEAKPKIC